MDVGPGWFMVFYQASLCMEVSSAPRSLAGGDWWEVLRLHSLPLGSGGARHVLRAFLLSISTFPMPGYLPGHIGTPKIDIIGVVVVVLGLRGSIGEHYEPW